MGAFAVYLLGGLAVALGPGELLLSLVPRPGRHLAYLLETIAGVAMITAAAFLWGYRKRLAQSRAPEFKASGRSSAWLGATITAIELPTVFPYFAAIATIVGADLSVWRVVFLLVIFNVSFILPLLAILAVLTFAGQDAQRVLGNGRVWLEARWPVVLAEPGADRRTVRHLPRRERPSRFAPQPSGYGSPPSAPGPAPPPLKQVIPAGTRHMLSR